jgi:hypothetical protein
MNNTDRPEEPPIFKSAALQYARLGYRVFPLRPGTKLPRFKESFHLATTDEKEISEHWDYHPDDNIGWSPYEWQKGIDVDTLAGHGKDGPTTYAKLAKKLGGELPDDGPLVLTPSDGLHYWITCDVGNYRDEIGPGVDIKGHKGYTVAPPSIIDKRDPRAKVYGQYRWLRDPTGDLPKVLQEWSDEIDKEVWRTRTLLDPLNGYMRDAHLLPPLERFKSVDRYVHVLKLFQKVVRARRVTGGFHLYAPTEEEKISNGRRLMTLQAEQRKPRPGDDDKRKRALGLLDWRIFSGHSIGEFYAPALAHVGESECGGRDVQTRNAMRFLAPLVSEGHLTRAELVDAIVEASEKNEHIPKNKSRSFVERQIDDAITKFSHPFDWGRLE